MIWQCCNFHGINSTVEIAWHIFRILADYRLRHLVNNVAIHIYNYIRMEITVLYLKISGHQLSISWSQISVYWLRCRVVSKLNLLPSNLQLMPWNLQIQLSPIFVLVLLMLLETFRNISALSLSSILNGGEKVGTI